ncbi:hypothetical protein MPSEU_000435300 [Mayamaea pseudoterrestris]|nr:hypothetical protein MPSEU_000435300 [Mayamaea pseudoterrestris]
MLASIVCHDVDPLQALFQSSSSSAVIPVSCSQEASHLSFDWSDFLITSSTEFSYDFLTTSANDQQVSYSEQDFSRQPQYVSCSEATIAANLMATSTGRRTRRALEAQRVNISNPNEVNNDAAALVTNPSTAPIVKNDCSTRRRVRFSSFIQIRSHNIVLGDHPSCAGGLAIGLDWTYSDETADFERFEQSSRKRKASQLRLSYTQRRERLMEATGCSGTSLLQQEYAMMMGGVACDSSIDASKSVLVGCHILRNSPSVERALMAARGLEDGYECIL